MAEQWIKWEPISGLTAKYYVESITDDLEELKIILSSIDDRDKNVQVVCKYPPGAYRCTKENFKYGLGQQKNMNKNENWTFFKVNNSMYMRWFSEESLGIYDSINFIHFSIVTENLIIDVLDASEPRVEFIG